MNDSEKAGFICIPIAFVLILSSLTPIPDIIFQDIQVTTPTVFCLEFGICFGIISIAAILAGRYMNGNKILLTRWSEMSIKYILRECWLKGYIFFILAGILMILSFGSREYDIVVQCSFLILSFLIGIFAYGMEREYYQDKKLNSILAKQDAIMAKLLEIKFR